MRWQEGGGFQKIQRLAPRKRMGRQKERKCAVWSQRMNGYLNSGNAKSERRDTELAAIVNPNNTKVWCSDFRK